MNRIRFILCTLSCMLTLETAFSDYDKEWDGPVTGTANWFTDENWTPPGEPAAGDTVLIAPEQNRFHLLMIEIADDDAACLTINIVRSVNAQVQVVIQGKTLTLGDAAADTTSIIDGEIVFEEAGSNPARLEVHSWVTFSVPVNGLCLFTAKEPAEFIRASSDGVGVEFAESDGELFVSGEFEFLVSVKHDATFFGVEAGDSVMKFGLFEGAAFSPELEISGTSLNAKTIEAKMGRVEFHDVKFASTAPAWLMKGVFSEFRVTDTINNIPNDITIESSALLNLRDNFTCNGKLTHKTGTIRVKACKSATITS